MNIRKFYPILFILLAFSCENRELNDGEEFRPRDLKADFHESHFSRIWIDGVEYLMLMRDNNNPHEGFGFMAIRGNIIIEKQDSTLAMLRTIGEFQIKILSNLQKKPENEVKDEFMQVYEQYLLQERPELLKLEQDSLIAR